MATPHFTLASLDAAQRFYDDKGFVVVDDVFSEAQIRLARQVWESILEKRRARGDHKYRPLLLPHIHYPAILDFIRSPSIQGSVRTLLRDDVQLLHSQLMFGPPGYAGFTPHQDNFTDNVKPGNAAIAVWIAMEDVVAENGALKVWSGSHQQGLYKVKFDWLYLLKRSPDIVRSYLKVLRPQVFGVENDTGVMERFSRCEVEARFEEIVLELSAGSVAFMHGDLIHASLPNSSRNRFRYSLLTNFIRRGSEYCSGILTGRKPVDLA